MDKDKDDYIVKLTEELKRVKKDRDKYIKWVTDLRGSLLKISEVAGDPKNWK